MPGSMVDSYGLHGEFKRCNAVNSLGRLDNRSAAPSTPPSRLAVAQYSIDSTFETCETTTHHQSNQSKQQQDLNIMLNLVY